MKNTTSTLQHALGAMAVGLAAAPLLAPAEPVVRASEEYPDFYAGDTTKGIDFVQSISVLAPAYCSNVKGDATVVFKAPGMTQARAFCWRQPTKEKPGEWGHDALLADIALGDDATGSFVFHADEFPNGPTTIRIQARDDKNHQDYCELQLFNLGGVVWNQGIPKADPPGAKGMKLVFSDDFDGPLSISPNGNGARYAAHKTGGGDFSGWQFSDPMGENEPFGQMGTFLRIHASKPLGTAGRSGILSSLRADGTGVCVPVPSYFECRFVAQSAPGTWPAFWTLTKGTHALDKNDPAFESLKNMGTDELDVVECYGGYGPKNPNSGGVYHSVSHFWGQAKPAWAERQRPDGSPNPDYKPSSFRTDALKIGGRSSWSWTPHTYGLAITETDTVYYFDNIEVGRHPTGPTSLAQPAWFLVNYAIGGISGWQIDMDRYGNQTDMWVDFVRVYCGSAQPPAIKVDGFAGASPARVAVSTPTPGAVIRYTLDGSDPTERSAVYTKPIAVAKPATFKAVVFADGVKPSPPAQAAVIAPPGVPGAVGISFATHEDQIFAATDVAGIGADAQGNWNTVMATDKTASAFVTADGAASRILLTIDGEANPQTGESWGFSGNDEKLKRGNLASNPRLLLSGIPHSKYDVVVILGAGIHNVQGEVSIAPQGADKPSDAYSFDYGWNGGKHAVATTRPGEAAKNTNYIVFKDVAGEAIAVTMKWGGGKGWTGIAAIQIIPRP
ncbi:MAG: chitobiase/beta-hexosaminidase C-terminal domain-containing protein [Kiritimatiellia bacterium]|jgi:hypothetical protein